MYWQHHRDKILDCRICDWKKYFNIKLHTLPLRMFFCFVLCRPEEFKVIYVWQTRRVECSEDVFRYNGYEMSPSQGFSTKQLCTEIESQGKTTQKEWKQPRTEACSLPDTSSTFGTEPVIVKEKLPPGKLVNKEEGAEKKI